MKDESRRFGGLTLKGVVLFALTVAVIGEYGVDTTAEAHRRIVAHLGTGSTYEKGNYNGLLPLVGRLARSTMMPR